MQHKNKQVSKTEAQVTKRKESKREEIATDKKFPLSLNGYCLYIILTNTPLKILQPCVYSLGSCTFASHHAFCASHHVSIREYSL